MLGAQSKSVHRLTPAAVWAICLLLSALAAAGDFASGPYYSFDFFYLIPVLIAARSLGRNTGFALAAALAALTVGLQALTGHPARYQLFLAIWAGCMKFAVAAVAVWLVCDRQQHLDRQQALILQLHSAVAELKQLRGLLPICAWCKRVRSANGDWRRLEEYLQENTDAKVTHSICADCAAKATSGIKSSPPRGT